MLMVPDDKKSLMFLRYVFYFFFFSSRRRHTRLVSDWSSDVCSSDLKVTLTPRIGKNVQSHLETDFEDELDAIKQYNASAAVCVREGDNGSRELFEEMIEDEEKHSLYLGGQLHTIREAGIENYLAAQMDSEEKGS